MKGRTYKRGDRWTGAFQVPDPAVENKRRTISKGGFARQREAQAWLRAALADYEAAPAAAMTSIEQRRLTLGALFDRWDRDVLANEGVYRPGTACNYRSLYRTYVGPHLAAVPVARVTGDHLARLWSTLRATPGRKTRRPPSEATLSRVSAMLGALFGYAADAGIIRVSPLVAVPRKVRPRSSRADVSPDRYWTPEQCATFLAAEGDGWYGSLWKFLLATGCRRGEALGLRWSDVDLEAGTVHFRRQRVVIDGVTVEQDRLKTGGQRVVRVDPGTVALLRSWRSRQAQERLRWGPRWEGADDLNVFTRENGQPLKGKSVADSLARACKRAGVPWRGVHGLRHSAVSLMIDAGANARVVQTVVGHKNVAITLGVYGHLFDGQAEAAMGAVTTRLGIGGEVAGRA